MLNKKLALNLHPPSTVSAAAAERKGDAGSSEKSFWTRVCNESHLKYVVTLHHVHISIIPIRQKKKKLEISIGFILRPVAEIKREFKWMI